MEENDVLTLLRDPDTFNYSSLLVDPEISDPIILNTVELFAFGTIGNYESSRSKYIVLDKICTSKLITLTLLSILSENVGNEIGIFDVLSQLVHLESSRELENLLIHLAVSGYIRTRIDQNKGLIHVQEVKVLRDAYNANEVKLRALDDKEIERKSVDWARNVLSRWLETKIIPTKEGLEEKN